MLNYFLLCLSLYVRCMFCLNDITAINPQLVKCTALKSVSFLVASNLKGVGPDASQRSIIAQKINFYINQVATHLGPLLLTWFNFNPSMNKSLHPL